MARTANAPLGGISMKHLSLVTLTFQNSALILVMHYSRIMPLVNGQRYHTSTSVFLNEVIKLGISLSMALHEMSQTLPPNTTLATLISSLFTAILSNESWKLAIPAVLYTIQNTLQYVAVSNLNAATFQVTYQLKILTTAIFSVLMLGRSLSPRKWISLLLLIIGVSIIQVPQSTATEATTDSKVLPRALNEITRLGSMAAHKLARSASYEGILADDTAQIPHMDRRIGLIAVLVACALSGLAGVTFEKILKDSTSAKSTTLWVRNCQLSFWSLFPSLFLGVIWKEGDAIAKTGFFAGYNWVVWTAILFQAAGGVIVALVINYADNIAKNFATSVSIVLSCVASAYFFDFQVTRSFFVGTCVVLLATYLYTKPDRAPSQAPMRFADLEKTRAFFSVFPRVPDIHTIAMNDDDKYYHRGHGGGASRQDSHLPRDRYQAPRYAYGNRIYEDVEHDAGLQLDSFDEQILQQTYPDRQQQAEQGKARLSLAPGPSRFFGSVPAERDYQREEAWHSNHSSLQSQVSCHAGKPNARGYQTAPDPDHLEHNFRSQLGRFAYYGEPPNVSSSDAQLGPSSSPALKAGQRRAEHDPISAGQDTARTPHVRPGRQTSEEWHGLPEALRYQQPSLAQSQHAKRPRMDFDEPQRQTVNPTAIHESPSTVQPRPTNLPHAPPVCQGIQLVPVSILPDRLRTVFSYPTFNAVQSKCFDAVYKSDNNFVLASPTGSGKTVILELAICRAVATNATGQYKIVYQAPTKALCSERQRDWQAKFAPVGLTCAELTGDSDAADVRNVQSANIIVTTPEKWDSITRKWKDHEKLMRLIKVFLIDEVHILKEDRGAVLEAVVSRMKSIGTDVRFVALSATVPNFVDVATWLGRNSSEPHTPAPHEKFGEEFRPVKLRKHVIGYVANSNDFGFEKVLDGKLPSIIAQYSEGKPIMIFCATRNSCLNTAKLIARWWLSGSTSGRRWGPPSRQIQLVNKELRETVASGVAFHHAGLDSDDRMQVERGYLSHDISVICCTSTLAVGVNLPCHLVIIKNTVTYTDEGLQEYSDLEMMQMLGRAGRPQFDDTAVAVIMTRQAKVKRYEAMVTGQEPLESKLHSNLVDHMNAEIGLGTIGDLVSARKWLKGTFLYVRLQQNPTHYRLEGAKNGQAIEEQVDDICFRDINLLREHNLVSGDDHFRCTEFGHSMARYYVHFETMKVFMGIQPKATPSEILSAIAQSSEFSRIRFRAGEKPFYKLLNKSPSIRFSIPVNLDLPAHKVSLIIQSVLGSADVAWDGEMAKHRSQYIMETQVVFKNINSLIRCIIDCQLCLGDSVSIHSALMLERSLGARVWDDSPLQMKQVESIGVVGVRKFVNAGIRSMEDLEACDAHRIEALLGRNPPFGMRVLETVKTFPKLRVSLNVQTSSAVKSPDGVKIQVKADIGFINEKPPQRFAGRPVYACLLADTSDGRKVHFARISAQRLGHGQSLTFPVLLTSSEQSINCYVMCDSISGSSRSATVKPQIAASMFPAIITPEPETVQRSNTSKRRADPAKPMRKRSNTSEDFGDGDIDDDELVKVTCGDLDFEHIDNFANPIDSITRKNTATNKPAAKSKGLNMSINTDYGDDQREPEQLSNGKWACKHACKDKNMCKHLCCKEGMDKPPKKHTATKRAGVHDSQVRAERDLSTPEAKVTQSKLQLTAPKRKISHSIEELDLTQDEKKSKADYFSNRPSDYRGLHQLHKTVQKQDPPASLHSVMHTKPACCYSQGGQHNLSFLQDKAADQHDNFSDYGDLAFDEISSHFNVTPPMRAQQESGGLHAVMPEQNLACYPASAPVDSHGSEVFDDQDSLFSDVMRHTSADNATMDLSGLDHLSDMDIEADLQDDDFLLTAERATVHDNEQRTGQDQITGSPISPRESRAPFDDSTSSSSGRPNDFRPAKHLLKRWELEELKQPTANYPTLRHEPIQTTANNGAKVPDLLDSCDGPPTVPDSYKGLQPWLFEEFGDIVELVDE
ncbi:nucleotide-sugar transporter-domain-containing protein [Ampelomyces quisqualis]|uniref:DNA 3'-5' helicase n=1 Tax=Ampelomyces quisqualis TaxID=50730 RepID=A0A6A5Q631_AMPQU|nr:nucleotide-sugar transporter-domain-containing protein [Ampelomyces quisqualis]